MPEFANPTVLPLEYEANRCARSRDDDYWCDTHSSPIGDSEDGWHGCTNALVGDLRAVANAYEAAQNAANALVETNYPAYEEAQINLIVPGLRISEFLAHLAEPEPH